MTGVPGVTGTFMTGGAFRITGPERPSAGAAPPHRQEEPAGRRRGHARANRFRSPGCLEEGQAAATGELVARAVALVRWVTSIRSTLTARDEGPHAVFRAGARPPRAPPWIRGDLAPLADPLPNAPPGRHRPPVPDRTREPTGRRRR